jgi:hypothetical protein
MPTGTGNVKLVGHSQDRWADKQVGTAYRRNSTSQRVRLVSPPHWQASRQPDDPGFPVRS